MEGFMTVQELIDLLSKLPPEMVVRSSALPYFHEGIDLQRLRPYLNVSVPLLGNPMLVIGWNWDRQSVAIEQFAANPDQAVERIRAVKAQEAERDEQEFRDMVGRIADNHERDEPR
jgi:hypothetical protein